MATITLSFDDSDPHEATSARRAINATHAYLALWDMDSWLRNKVKYEDKEVFQEARDALREFLDDYDINLDDIE
jgi:hypothetical protein